MASSGSFGSPYAGIWPYWPDSPGLTNPYGPACPYPAGTLQAADWQMQMQMQATALAQLHAARRQAGTEATSQTQPHGDVIDIPPEDVRAVHDTVAIEGPKK